MVGGLRNVGRAKMKNPVVKAEVRWWR